MTDLDLPRDELDHIHAVVERTTNDTEAALASNTLLANKNDEEPILPSARSRRSVRCASSRFENAGVLFLFLAFIAFLITSGVLCYQTEKVGWCITFEILIIVVQVMGSSSNRR